MRFALATGQDNCTWESLCRLWETADVTELWESAWTGDHFYPFLHDPTGPCLEGWVTLTALAQRTRRMRIGVLVSGMPHRNPAVLAKMATTLDHVSGGRFELGLGAAWNHLECDAYGIELGSLRTRMDRFAEGLEVVTSLLTEPVTNFAGEHYTLRDARCEPKPVQRPRLPITIGGTGERRTLPLVARWADHWDLGFTAPADVPRKLELLAGECAAIGRDVREIAISAVVRTEHRHLAEVVDEVDAYERAGCQIALVEALPQEGEIERLTEALEPLAA
jgi:F420-dependent oxidoreductase-like protein